MTLGQMVKGQPTLTQLETLTRADRLLVCGRYYGGQLTPEQVEALTPQPSRR
jgi:hypothetical protein